MKADERKKLEKNLLAEKLSTTWEGLSSSSASANRIWTVLLGILVLGLAWMLYSRHAGGTEAGLWYELDYANDLKSLEKIITNSPTSTQGKLARFHLSRVQMLEALGKLDAPNGDDRVKGADELATVRATYAELRNDKRLPDSLIQEAMIQTARAEEALATVPKADDPNVTRGTLDEAKKLFEEVVAKYPNSYAGKEAAKRVEHIKAKKADIEKLYAELAKDQVRAHPIVPPVPAPAPPAVTEPTLPGTDSTPKLPDAPPPPAPTTPPPPKQ